MLCGARCVLLLCVDGGCCRCVFPCVSALVRCVLPFAVMCYVGLWCWLSRCFGDRCSLLAVRVACCLWFVA